MLFDFVEPVLDIVEGFLFGDIIDEDDPVRALIVCRSDCFEALLAGRIPNVELEFLVVYW